jgi:hypothetical protein
MGNAAHQHLLVNHLPVFASLLAIPILFLALVLRRERGLLLAGVFLLLATAGGTWASMQTGEDAYEFVGDAQSDGKEWADHVQDEAIAEHEERAENAQWVAYAAAVIGLIVLVMAHGRPFENPIPRMWIFVVLLCAALTAVAMGYVANVGGPIVHREIRDDGFGWTPPKAPEAVKPAETKPADGEPQPADGEKQDDK